MANSRSARSEDSRLLVSVLAVSVVGFRCGRSAPASAAVSIRCVCGDSLPRGSTWLDSPARHRGRQPTPGREKLEARIIDWTLHRKPSGGATEWSTRGLATSWEPPRRMSRRSGARLVFNPSPPAISGQQRS